MLGGAASSSPAKADDLAAAAAAAAAGHVPTAAGDGPAALGATSTASQQPSAATGVGAGAGADSDSDTSRRLPVRVMDGPSTNPEPPPEGLSPPLGEAGLNNLTAEEQHVTLGVGSSEDGDAGGDPARLILPPELREAPPGEPPSYVQQQVDFYHKKQHETGKSIVAVMRKMRRWNNPDFLEKMVNFYQLDQYGSSFSTDVFDPQGIPADDKWPALAAQLAARKRARGAEVKFTSAGQQAAAAGTTGAAAAATAVSVPGTATAAAVVGVGQSGLVAAAVAAAAAGPAAAPKMLPPDPRAAQAQAQALANTLLAGAKKSKWDK